MANWELGTPLRRPFLQPTSRLGESQMTLRPQPRFPEPDTEPFWEATKQRNLVYQTCDKADCTDRVIFYPRAHCDTCGSLETSWNTSKGAGVVYTYSVIMQSRHPAFKDLGPYALAYVAAMEVACLACYPRARACRQWTGKAPRGYS